jgi:DNA-binding response OmpR family regulator
MNLFGRSKSRTLIVEEDAESNAALGEVLKRLGHKPVLATTVADGLKKLKKRPQQLILEILLPDGKGTAILKRIREKKLPIRVAVVTESKDEKLLDEVLACGPDAVYTKPMALTDLLNFLKTK